MPDLRPFGRSGLELSPLCLGGNALGWTADEDASLAVPDAYVAGGGNVVDSANIYSAWVPGNSGGESEAVIGRWVAARGHHDDLVIMTKVCMAGGEQPKGLTREIILRAADESLRRLGTDRIDIYSSATSWRVRRSSCARRPGSASSRTSAWPAGSSPASTGPACPSPPPRGPRAS